MPGQKKKQKPQKPQICPQHNTLVKKYKYITVKYLFWKKLPKFFPLRVNHSKLSPLREKR